jgi:hypothetical protein
MIMSFLIMDLGSGYTLCCNQLVCPAKSFQKQKFSNTTEIGEIPMKNNFVRAFVVVLALAGFSATTVSAHSAAKAKQLSSTTQDTPIPTCAPSDPTACGLH